MELRRGLLALCLLSIIHASNAEPQVSIYIPSLLKSGELEKACLTVKRHTSPMDVFAAIEVDGTNYTVINDQIQPGDVFKTYELQVPGVTDPTPVFLLVHAVSGNYSYIARRSVVLAPTGNVAFIRTDKELYKGGQEVRFYVLSVNNNLRPVEETFSLVYVTDPNGNRLYQWLDQSTNGAFLSLRFPILDDPDLGVYSIVAERKSGSSVSKTIKVDSYVLPKFSIMLKAPNTITILDTNVSVEVNARYTYDQGVPGKISGRLCRPPANFFRGNACNRNPDGICVSFTGETDIEGTFKGSVDLSSYQLDRSGYQNTLTMQVTLTEQGTNVQVTESRSIYITSQLGRVYFDSKNMLPYFKKGLSLPVGMIVENALGQPESGQVVELQVDGKFVANLTSDENGRAAFEVDTSAFESSGVNLQLIYKTQEQCFDSNWVVPTYSSDSHQVNRFFSRTNSFVQLQGPVEELQCGKSYNIRVQYIFGKDALAAGETTVKFAYMVMSRSKIMASGEYSVDVSTSRKGEFNLTYETSPDHVPIVQYIVQTMLMDEVVGDVLNLNLENCFKNQVSANFSSAMGTPGSNVDLEVIATPASACFARVYDVSLQLLSQKDPFSAAMVYNSLQYIRLYGYYAAGFNVAPAPSACIDPNERLLINGTYWQPVSFPQEHDVSKVFSDIGMHVITKTPYEQPQLCSTRFSSPFRPQPMFAFARPGAEMFMESDAAPSRTATTTVTANEAPQIVSMRSYFPELWFFGGLPVGDSGFASVLLDVPGTITKWQSDVVCLSNQTGFGMTKHPANFTSFQEMFVDLSLPDSIIRGEIMRVVASVANYLNKCIKVRITLQSSNDYTATPLDGEPVKCVCSQSRVAYAWQINATSIGASNVTVTAETINIGETCEGPADPNEPSRKDTIVRSFNVEPQGIKQRVTKTDFVCVNGANSTVQVNINPSGNIVPGSMSAKVQVIGDMLGRALTNPEALIAEPTGCGEQNLATLMPIARVLEYLNLTGRLTEQLRLRGIQNMITGVARQMRYRHPDGSFSAFGPGRSKPSAWLTLLTLKTLWAVKSHILIDDNSIKQGLLYLERLQELPSGRFKPEGTLFNSGLKGGADDGVGFTCAVVSFLAQTAYAATPTLLRPALSYLDEESRKEQTVYNIAMLYDAFRVTGNEERANAMYEKLAALAIDEGDTLHWERPVRPNQPTPFLFSPTPPSAELELTAIVLKALVYGENSSTVSTEKLNKMAKISTWIVRQQNIHGSYRTTSDTMAILEALCPYAALVYRPDATNTVELKSGDQVIRQFNVNQQNRILLQSQVLPQVPGDYSMVVSGTGCILLQTGAEFHVPVAQENGAFSLSVTTFPANCKNGVAYTVDIQVNGSYHGMQNKSNMAVMEIPLLSGYTMNYDSLRKLQSKFPKVEVKNGNLIVYFNDMTSEEVSFIVTQDMGNRVDNFQQRTVIFYDYYEKDENASGALYHPCTLQV